MDLAFFESMKTEEAQEYLSEFLALEKSALDTMFALSVQDGVALDYQLARLSSTLKWFLAQVTFSKRPVPLSEPIWIRQNEDDGFIEFDEGSKLLVLRASYYMGETFVQANKKLKWAVGRPDFVQKNMPVITGFLRSHELAPIMVVENVFLRILGDGLAESEIDQVIDSWSTRMP
jgi:hypothetical protein